MKHIIMKFDIIRVSFNTFALEVETNHGDRVVELRCHLLDQMSIYRKIIVDCRRESFIIKQCIKVTYTYIYK